MRRLRILFVSQSYYPFVSRGGPAIKVRALALGLARRNHMVEVVTADLGVCNSKISPNCVRTGTSWQNTEEGVTTHYLPTRGSYRSLTWNPGLAAFCRERLREFDVVHIFGTYDILGPVVAWHCRRYGVPYMLEPMGMFRPIVRNFLLKRIYRSIFGKVVARGAANIVATSAQEFTELANEGIPPERLTIRRNGTETPDVSVVHGAFRRKWNIPQSAFVVLFLGRIVSKKSPELLLEAFAQWQRESTTDGARLIFVGPFDSFSYRQKLLRQAEALGLGRNVLFTGELFDEAKWAALADADVFVLPSQNENFGTAAAEAIAAGTPAIVTEACGVAPFIAGRVGLVIPHDRDALVRALHQLEDRTVREGFIELCPQVAEELSWDEPLTQAEASYAAAASKRGIVPHQQCNPRAQE